MKLRILKPFCYDSLRFPPQVALLSKAGGGKHGRVLLVSVGKKYCFGMIYDSEHFLDDETGQPYTDRRWPDVKGLFKDAVTRKEIRDLRDYMRLVEDDDDCVTVKDDEEGTQVCI